MSTGDIQEIDGDRIALEYLCQYFYRFFKDRFRDLDHCTLIDLNQILGLFLNRRWHFLLHPILLKASQFIALAERFDRAGTCLYATIRPVFRQLR